jgi:hypothetical protein
MDLELDQFRATEQQVGRQPAPKHPPRHKRREWFLKGPIPGNWLGRASALPGKSLHVALAVWHEAGLKKCREVKLTRTVLAKFDVLPDSGRRGLKWLEGAGLVVVRRHSGRCPVVTIEEVE